MTGATGKGMCKSFMCLFCSLLSEVPESMLRCMLLLGPLLGEFGDVRVSMKSQTPWPSRPDRLDWGLESGTPGRACLALAFVCAG